MSEGFQHATPVSIPYATLISSSIPLDTLEQAFGPTSLGILVVTDLPQHFSDLRKKLLSYASLLGRLPKETLEKYELPEKNFLVGWSCGKERLGNGEIDKLKGSWYANVGEGGREGNVWVDEDVEKNMKGFRITMEELCHFIVDTAKLVARACDTFSAAHIPDYTPSFLESMIADSQTTKARLLHYYPSDEAPTSADSWCGTHLDHGCLTGLTSALWTDESTLSDKAKADDIVELDSAPDPEAGLYIHGRDGALYKVGIPRNGLGFQTGEALEKITRGGLKAVPHFVKGTRPGVGLESNPGAKIARNTLAVFTQPNLDVKVDGEKTFEVFQREIIERNTTY
ncbi:Clavaminate synthase-like protein [Ascobolus immersus RN42]|uniref:Clavaminate synthase-like protein n=1 Tax=Ascobolus immersus RN42 TaxID=1160509 RepID=A0A3N4IHH2_ASCIM|nr:Clavaminate synthase-like protein [Ascobolus immersus RN42]